MSERQPKTRKGNIMKDFDKIIESQYKALLKEKEALIQQSERNSEKLEKLKKYLSMMNVKTEEIESKIANEPIKRKRGWPAGRPRKVVLASNAS